MEKMDTDVVKDSPSRDYKLLYKLFMVANLHYQL